MRAAKGKKNRDDWPLGRRDMVEMLQNGMEKLESAIAAAILIQ